MKELSQFERDCRLGDVTALSELVREILQQESAAEQKGMNGHERTELEILGIKFRALLRQLEVPVSKIENYWRDEDE